MSSTNLAALVRTLAEAGVEFIIAGGGTYDDLVGESDASTVFGSTARCLSLERLIATTRAAGRPKDLVALSELEALLEERGRRG